MPGLSVLVLIPTYNESENIELLVEKIFSLNISGLEVVVVDDDSPDGTSDKVEALASRRPGLRLIRRRPPAGRGLAGREGFLYGIERGAEFLVEMDGDLSHQPKHIPALLEAMQGCDVAIGSRQISGGSDQDRGLGRRWLTLFANLFSRTLLGLPVYDTNSGFRCFSRKALKAMEPQKLQSSGPSIIHESLFRMAQAGMRFQEVPIEFIDRKSGESKLGLGRLAIGYFWILGLRLGLFR